MLTFNLNAQNVDFKKSNFPDQKKQLKKAIKNIKKGDRYYGVGEGMYYFTAIGYYLMANSFNSDNALLNYKIGNCYMHTIQKINSIPYLEKAIEMDSVVAPDINFLLGQAYQLTYKFKKAKEQYEKYRQTLFPKRYFSDLGIDVDKKIDECNNAKKLISNPVLVSITNLKNINSTYPEYNPIINADESIMMFTSCRPDSSLKNTKDPTDNKYYEDIYITNNNGSDWSLPENPGKPLNTELNDAIIGLSPDGQKLFIYKGSNGGDIYQCNLEGDKWSKPKKLNNNINTKYHESSASFSYDGRTIYFVSNKNEGYGGSDIYMSKINELGDWGKAINIGSNINTRYDEEGVFMHPDGKTLYFSSEGHKTMGGLDIFKSAYENGKWSEPVNLGYPVNTPDDDVFFSISASGEHGYFSSIRPEGNGEEDIYCITFLEYQKKLINNTEDNLLASIAEPISETITQSKTKTSNLTLVKGEILDGTTSKPVEATIEIIDNEKNEVVATFKSNSKTGKYLISLPSGHNYGMVVEAEEYLFHSENFDISPSTEYREIKKNILLKKIEVGKKIVLKNIFFDFDKASIRSESMSELSRLTKLMNNVPTLKIEVSGHTDNIGSAAYNKNLSEKRAKAVVDYLTKKRISKERLTYKGYGFSEPIATNNTEGGRQQNRRTEFKVLSK
jgi:outer membrane protein OmpA-like peptidoglycan-associated protein/tetratricopeptide (TPR) repeat protein